MPVWNGMFGKTKEKGLSYFLSKLPEIGQDVTQFALQCRFFLGPLSVDHRIRRRIEAALADHIYNYKQSGAVRKFQEEGIYYERTKKDQEPIIINLKYPGLIRGMPEQLEAKYIDA